jgi:hypothetical protein
LTCRTFASFVRGLQMPYYSPRGQGALTDAQINNITHLNATRTYNYDPFKQCRGRSSPSAPLAGIAGTGPIL